VIGEPAGTAPLDTDSDTNATADTVSSIAAADSAVAGNYPPAGTMLMMTMHPGALFKV
jgi:hypothetical protein